MGTIFTSFAEQSAHFCRVGGNLRSAPGLMLIFREPEVAAVNNMNHELLSEPSKNSHHNLQCLHMSQKSNKEKLVCTETEEYHGGGKLWQPLMYMTD